MVSVVMSAGLSVVFNELFKRFEDKLQILKPKEIQIVNVKQDPNDYSITILEKVKTTNQTWNIKDKANLIIENEIKTKCIVKEISIIPDKNFKTHGKLIITIDDVPVFKSKSFGAFEDVSECILKINKTISQKSKVKLFMVTKDDIEIGLTAQITFGE